MNAQGFARLINAIKAIGRSNTGTDVVLAPLNDFLHDMWIRHVGTGHADHIQQAGVNRVTGRGHIRDFSGVECWHACQLLYFACEI